MYTAEDITCYVCFEVLDDPLRLACSKHSVCRGCAEGMLTLHREGGTEDCLLCPRGCPEKGPMVADTALASFLASRDPFLASVETPKNGYPTVQCDKCETSQATLFCETCGVVLCPPCHTAHHVGKWRTHRVSPLPVSVPRTSQTQSLQEENYCTEHPGNEVVVYCVDEQRLMCIICLQEKSTGGHRRRCIPIADIVDALGDELDELLQALHEQKRIYRQKVLDLEREGHRLREGCLAEIHGMRQVFAGLRAQLDAKERSLTEGLMARKEEAVRSLEGKREELASMIARMNYQLWISGGFSMGSLWDGFSCMNLLNMRNAWSALCKEAHDRGMHAHTPRKQKGPTVTYALSAVNVERLATIE